MTRTCCGRERGYIDKGRVYAAEERKGRLCPWCIAAPERGALGVGAARAGHGAHHARAGVRRAHSRSGPARLSSQSRM
ncbi:CbrC family protein [Streptomyces yunnanensis]|uniref:CbrC family protein n=1 Tax=Streptomyces yunnanensis TaxID=156453 RepID=A0ABY8A138_9ACTN|nr:CbrC family protein [Streptomyces yunnanensis]WEB38615.1 CbrC family protein [Streptomyces yunnanensis]